MMAAYRLLSEQCDYPLHVGVTEAGTARMGLIKSGMGIGGLLLEGIGDTLRVSLTDEPEAEVRAGFDILRAAGYAVAGREIISCPTCGRTQYPMTEIANEVERRPAGRALPKAAENCHHGLHRQRPRRGPATPTSALPAAGTRRCCSSRAEKIRMLKGDIVGQLLEEIHKL